MITLTHLQKFLDGYLYFDSKLSVEKIDPHMTNGLMVKGSEEVKKIGFCVSASVSLFEKAKQHSCDAVIVHHAFNMPPFNRYDYIFQKRINYLLHHDISLFGYHFLLDAHPEVGNNAQILKTFGAKPIRPYIHRGNPWGWVGELAKEKDLYTLIGEFTPYVSPRVVVYNFGPKKIKRVAAVSGKGAPLAADMQGLIDGKIDLFITGEVHEWNKELFREAKINFLAGGHYATEKFGITALMKKIAKQFPDVKVEWLEVLNEI